MQDLEMPGSNIQDSDIQDSEIQGQDREYPTKKQRIPKHPKKPERICWGCNRLCAADKMMCGNGSERSQHPCELWGEDWYQSLTEDELKYIDLI